MKHPCVELYFDMETADCNIRVWMKTNNVIEDGHVGDEYWSTAKELRGQVAALTHYSMSAIVQFLEEHSWVSAFQVSLREDYRNFAIVCYREWP